MAVLAPAAAAGAAAAPVAPAAGGALALRAKWPTPPPPPAGGAACSLLPAAAVAAAGLAVRARGARRAGGRWGEAGGGRRRCLRQWLRAAKGPEEGAAVEVEAPPKGPTPLHFAAGDQLLAAKRLVQTRVHAVAPWGKDVDRKPIFALSDGSGNVARRLARAAFRQFGTRSRSWISVFSKVQTEEIVEELVEKAVEKEGALCAYTLAEPKLCAFLESQCAARGVPCINLLETTLAVMEKKFGMRRALDEGTEEQEQAEAPEATERKASLGFADDDLGDILGGLGGAEKKSTVFAVSDTSGETVAAVVRAALQRLPGCGVDTVTVCPRVNTLEEVNHIAREAFARDSVVIFSLASPGMSRFLRQQCERVKVTYADVYQPVVIAMEAYLDYPPVGVAGGLDLEELRPESLQWDEQPV